MRQTRPPFRDTDAIQGAAALSGAGRLVVAHTAALPGAAAFTAVGRLDVGAATRREQPVNSLAIRPTIYPMPPGATVTVEDPVIVDLRSVEFRESKQAIEKLCLAIEQSNQVGREIGDKMLGELKAGLEYIAGPKPSRKVLDLLLVNPLYAAVAIFTGTAVAELAKVAVKALFKLISPEIDIGL